MIKYILSIIYLFFTTLGIYLMKIGGDSFHVTVKGGLSIKMGWLTFFGFLAYVVSFLIWQKLVVTFDLSVMVPILVGIVQLLVFLIAVIILKESINIYNIFGILLLISGIVLLTIKK